MIVSTLLPYWLITFRVFYLLSTLTRVNSKSYNCMHLLFFFVIYIEKAITCVFLYVSIQKLPQILQRCIKNNSQVTFLNCIQKQLELAMDLFKLLFIQLIYKAKVCLIW